MSSHVTYVDLKLLADCYFTGITSTPSLIVSDGFGAATDRLRRAGLVEVNPQNRSEVRITEDGCKVAERLIGTLERSVEFFLS